jgi:hypothetical protein
LNEIFFKYKQDLINLRATLENHFNKCMASIQAGLPEVMDEDNIEDDDICFEVNSSSWTCPVCMIRNESTSANC